MFRLTHVADPDGLVKQIKSDARNNRDGAFSTWKIEARTDSKGETHQALVHVGQGGWESAGAFQVYASGSEVKFRWFNGEKEKYGYLHGRLLEQLITHYGALFEQAVFHDAR